MWPVLITPRPLPALLVLAVTRVVGPVEKALISVAEETHIGWPGEIARGVRAVAEDAARSQIRVALYRELSLPQHEPAPDVYQPAPKLQERGGVQHLKLCAVLLQGDVQDRVRAQDLRRLARRDAIVLHEPIDDGDREHVVATLGQWPRDRGLIAPRRARLPALVLRRHDQDGARLVPAKIGVVVGLRAAGQGRQRQRAGGRGDERARGHGFFRLASRRSTRTDDT